MSAFHRISYGEDAKETGVCSCGECPDTCISRRTQVRIMHGALQAMDDLQGEFEKLAPGSTIDMWELGTVYPLNWIPENAINPRREALIGAYSILYVIYKTVQDGGVPDIERIGEMCEKSENFMPHTSDFIKCGGTVGYIARELTMQVEADIRGEAYNVDSEELVEALNSIPPCALDADLYYWRQALGML